MWSSENLRHLYFNVCSCPLLLFVFQFSLSELSSHNFWYSCWLRAGGQKGSRQGQEFPFFRIAQTGLEPTHPPIQCIARALSPWVKLPEREAEHLPPPSAEMKKM